MYIYSSHAKYLTVFYYNDSKHVMIRNWHFNIAGHISHGPIDIRMTCISKLGLVMLIFREEIPSPSRPNTMKLESA